MNSIGPPDNNGKPINTELQSDSDAVENKLDLLRQTVEKFGGEHGQIAQALAEIKKPKGGGSALRVKQEMQTSNEDAT